MKNSHAPLAALLLTATLFTAASGAFAQDAAQKPDQRAPVVEAKPALVVTVDAEGAVFFMKEKVGTTQDVGALTKKLREAIEKNRPDAAREDEEEETAGAVIFICASPDLKYGDVVKIVDAIKEAGGKPVGLDTDCKPQG